MPLESRHLLTASTTTLTEGLSEEVPVGDPVYYIVTEDGSTEQLGADGEALWSEAIMTSETSIEVSASETEYEQLTDEELADIQQSISAMNAEFVSVGATSSGETPSTDQNTSIASFSDNVTTVDLSTTIQNADTTTTDTSTTDSQAATIQGALTVPDANGRRFVETSVTKFTIVKAQAKAVWDPELDNYRKVIRFERVERSVTHESWVDAKEYDLYLSRLKLIEGQILLLQPKITDRENYLDDLEDFPIYVSLTPLVGPVVGVMTNDVLNSLREELENWKALLRLLQGHRIHLLSILSTGIGMTRTHSETTQVLSVQTWDATYGYATTAELLQFLANLVREGANDIPGEVDISEEMIFTSQEQMDIWVRDLYFNTRPMENIW